MLCIVSKLILPRFKFIFLLPGNGKDYENEFKLQKKKYTEISATLPSPQKASILKLRCTWSFNPLSPNIHKQILQTDLYTLPYRTSWEKLIKDQRFFSL